MRYPKLIFDCWKCKNEAQALPICIFVLNIVQTSSKEASISYFVRFDLVNIFQ